MTQPVVGIVGLGLIGGSLARDLAATGLTVLGYDRDENTVTRALDEGVLHDTFGHGLRGIDTVDWLVLAIPVDQTVTVLRALSPRLHNATLVTDVGSTKLAICTAAREFGIGATFVGSHPFAGDHRAGWDAARKGLFNGERVFLCDSGESGRQAIDEARRLWSLCGAECLTIDAAEHDRRLAFTSHLPQMVSYALALALADAGTPHESTGRGARDMLRLAASSNQLWSAVAIQNGDNLADALRRFEGVIGRLRHAVETGDRQTVVDLLHAARSAAPPSDGP